MHRRNILKTVASAMISAGLFASGRNPRTAASTLKTSAKMKPRTPVIQTLDHVALFYKDWGEGKPVLFVHSWALNSDMWQYQMNHLTGHNLRCIAYDRRGHGRSSQPGGRYDYDTLADDLAAVIEHLDLKDVALVSHSMGAGEVIRYLSRSGSRRINRIVLIAPTTPFPLKTDDNPSGVDRNRFDALRAALSKDSPYWFAFDSPERIQQNALLLFLFKR